MKVDWNSDLSNVKISEIVDPIEIDKNFTYATLVDAGLSLPENGWIWRYIVAGKKMIDLVRSKIEDEILESSPIKLVEIDWDMPENEIWMASEKESKDVFNPPEEKDTIAIVKVTVKE